MREVPSSSLSEPSANPIRPRVHGPFSSGPHVKLGKTIVMNDVQNMPLPLADKVVLITGGTGGIGKATAIGLATLGAQVGITGRDRARAEQAAADIRAASGNQAVYAFAADMTSQAEVRRLASAILDAYPRLDVLVNNVGGFWAHRRLTVDGLERTFALNHLAPFLLTNLLLDRLKASAPITSPNSPPSCSPTNWPAAWRVLASQLTPCIQASCAPTSALKTRRGSSPP